MIKKSKKIAQRSSHRRYKTSCLIVAPRDEIVSWGVSHTSSTIYSNLLSLHAETHALFKARHLDLRGHSAYICTISGRSGNCTWGKPCLHCCISLRAAGIDKIYYTTPGGDFEGPTDFENELESLKDYSMSNNYGRKDWMPPMWAINKKERKKNGLA